MTDIPTGKEIEGSYRNHIDSRFISSIDLMGHGDIEVEIERVEKLETLTVENKKTVKAPILIYFQGKKKPLVACKTNLNQIAMALKTSVVSKWKCRKVLMFAEPGKYFGKEQYAVRFRSQEVKT